MRIVELLKRNITGQTLARIAVEVCEEEDVKLLVESKTVDWNQRALGEDPAIFWAVKNQKFEIVKILLKCSQPGKLRDQDGHSLEKVARDRFLEGQEEYREILEVIPGTLEYNMEYVNKVQMEVNRQNQMKIRQLEKLIENCVKQVNICIIKYFKTTKRYFFRNYLLKRLRKYLKCSE